MMRGLARRFALWLLLAAGAAFARAETPVTLFKSFAGTVDFVGAQATMRNKNNDKDPCSVVSSASTLSLGLSGIPNGATIVSAQLYWSGSGAASKADYIVNFEGAAVTAPATRQYTSATIGGGYDYFGGAADVTAQVAAKRNGSYSVSGLSINSGSPYCETEGVLGGFALLVVYSHSSEPYRVLNIYEGFQYFRYSGLTVNLSNFRVPNPLPSGSTARLGHITWEGDVTLQQNGEELLFNGTEMTDKLNTEGNQFNSKSNIDGDSKSYGIDFDAYTIAPSSNLFKAGQTSASTSYRSGADLVLLNAEIIAMPNVPTADLAITMTRNGELQVGRNTSYTINVSNGGPSPANGPIVVTDTLPAGLNFVSAAGTGWSCSSSGQTVTCSAPGPLAKGASLPALALTVQASAAGTYTNLVAVAGQSFDNVSGNDSATNTGSAVATGAAAWRFTAAPCAAGALYDTPSCRPFAGPVTAGSAATVYVTAVAASGNDLVATPVNPGAGTTVPLRFSLNCVNPAKGHNVAPSYGGAAQPLCADGAAMPAAGSASWSGQLSLVFAANAPSAVLPSGFAYEDVGEVALNLIDGSNHTATSGFVVKPFRLAFAQVRRTGDNAPNPAAANAGGTGFARAGEPFTLAVGARTATGKWAPGFGSEGAQVGLSQVEQAGLPAVESDNGFNTLVAGTVRGTDFHWDEVGIVQLAPQLTNKDYLGAGDVEGEQLNVGRFYPDHFETVVQGAFACLPHMQCPIGSKPTGEVLAVSAAVYSGQPFAVTVRPRGYGGIQLSNYSGAFAHKITLGAFDSPNGAAANPRAGTLSANTIDTVAAGTQPLGNPVYELPARFAAAAPRALDWTAPAAIYLRATAPDTTVRPDGTAVAITITSQQGVAVEGGVMVVNGRLQLANAFGSELLRLPVRMNAQYWTGSAWENNASDNASAVADSAVFSDCQKRLASGSGASNCDPALVKLAPGPVKVLQKGAASVWLQPPGAGNVGSAWLQMGDKNPYWLPSTRARAVFGIYKSPLIYLREVY